VKAYDALVIGGGIAGITAARVLTHLGQSVALVESRQLGGDCTNFGCVPSKTLIRLASIWHEAKQAQRAGLIESPGSLNFPAVMAQVRRVVETVRRYESPTELAAEGISVLNGQARFVRPQGAAIGEEQLTFRKALICTGSRPMVPLIAGLDQVAYLTNESIFDIEQGIERLVVLGAGPVGLELGQAFARLGSRVTVIDVMDRVLAQESPELSLLLAHALIGDGVKLILGAEIRAVSRKNQELELRVRLKDQNMTLTADAILVATGRRPAVEFLDLNTVGVQAGPKGIIVDDELRTSGENIYAAGDVTGLSGFTHIASYQGSLAARNAAGQHRRLDQQLVPRVVFTDPEFAAVGLSEELARQSGIDVITVEFPISAVDRSLIEERPGGLLKLVAAAGSQRRLLGAQLLCPKASEIIHELAVAIRKEESAAFVASTFHAYPTMALGLQQAAAYFFSSGRALSGPLRQDLAGTAAPEL
jgi:pyruvate/2-oxoglutarate dehydrogenase complex dihydrolipoamide dehydrogenase (E3) component